MFRRHFAFSAYNDMAYIYERWLQSKGLYLNLSINYKLIHLFVILKGNYLLRIFPQFPFVEIEIWGYDKQLLCIVGIYAL